MKRLITAGIIIPLLILYILKLPAAYYAGLITLGAAISLYEFYAMYRIKGALMTLGLAMGIAVVWAGYVGRGFEAAMLAFLLISSTRLFIKPDPGNSLSDIAPVVLGIVYIPCLMGYHVDLRKAAPGLPVFLYGAVWSADGLALYMGKWLGKHKLYESMSPNKTIEGAVGSLIGGVIGVLILWNAMTVSLPPIPLKIVILCGLTVGAVTILGDLVESMFKRDAGVKDSGVLFPGHGGFLDKLDGSLFAAPVLYWMLKGFGVI